MEKLQVFNNPDFGNVRAFELDGVPWFVGKDAASALEYADTDKAIREHVDAEDKQTLRVPENTPLKRRGNPNMTIINESGLYALILGSKLPKAKAFKRWITHDVIPAIRKTGGYIHGAEGMTEAEIMAKAFMIASRTIQEQGSRIQELETRNTALTLENQSMKPKADYYDALADKNGLTSFRETAKALGVGQKALVSFLLEEKYIYRNGRGYLTAYQTHVKDGLFEIKEFYNEKSEYQGFQTFVTQKGRARFLKLCNLMKGTE